MQPNQFFDYDGAIEDLRQMYERGRCWIAEHITDTEIPSPTLMAIYDHTLELAYALMAFSELSITPEAV